MKALLAAIAALLGLTTNAFAWGTEGHRIAAEIAEQYLTPDTVRQVRELLALENETTLASVANWADEIRRQRPETAHWHYVNIPIHPPAGTPPTYDPTRDCPSGDCVVAAIGRFEAVLRDKAAAPRQRLEALKFLVHLVADIAQPLHCANDDDRGGNAIQVEFEGRPADLHAVWDTGILVAAKIENERAYALKLAQSITPAEAANWRGGTAADWANDSYGIASRLIYGEWPHGPGALPSSYEQSATYVVQVQLEKAGVRLAAMLNNALG